jgi:NADPH2:quinone reductase
VDPIDPLILFGKALFLTRPNLPNHLLTRAEVLTRSRDLFGAVQDGSLKVRIDQRIPLAEAARAHQYIEGRNTLGKVILIP